MNRSLGLFAFSCFVGMATAACGEDPASQVCAPGETQVCVCADGDGAQACNDDGSGWGACECNGGSSDDSGSDDTMADDTTMGDTTEESTDGTDATTDSTDTTDGTDTTGTSTTGSMADWQYIQNDGFVDGAMVGVQGGFVMDECWASTYQAPDSYYPFTVVGVQALISGLNSEAVFTVGVWSVDADGKPVASMGGQVEGMFTGSDMAFNEADFQTLGMTTPVVVEEGQFAIVFCHSNHSGYPSIARDGDGSILPGKNWIRDTTGTWVESSTFLLTGDWIMRAAVIPNN